MCTHVRYYDLGHGGSSDFGHRGSKRVSSAAPASDAPTRWPGSGRSVAALALGLEGNGPKTSPCRFDTSSKVNERRKLHQLPQPATQLPELCAPAVAARAQSPVSAPGNTTCIRGQGFSSLGCVCRGFGKTAFAKLCSCFGVPSLACLPEFHLRHASLSRVCLKTGRSWTPRPGLSMGSSKESLRTEVKELETPNSQLSNLNQSGI